ncbi:MAG TPA: hypothetical protein VH590_13945 [Ktedonobacterales bacterium]|jgi:hypothetical protein
MALSLEQFQDRLRVWSARAAHEVINSDGTIAASWRGQQRVLGAVAMYMEGAGAGFSPTQVRLRLIDDREAARRAWEATTDPRQVAELAGEVAAYDLILTLLKDAGRVWSAAPAASPARH